jgi:AAA domain (dynein-related subfamily)
MAPEKRVELERGFAKYVEQYLLAPEGRRHLAEFARVRAQGRDNYRTVVESRRANADITDLLLNRWLPHANSTSNRNRGCWVHVAPAVTGDIKKWFENSNWVNKEDWPRVADLIFAFVTRCNERPDDLESACKEFADSQYSKGFQTGMLSPMLNALHPDRFFVINSKTRKALNYYLDSEFRLSLRDYAACNAAARRFVDREMEPLRLRYPEVAGSDSHDVFDIYCHWLVGVEKFLEEQGDEEELDVTAEDAEVIRYWKVAPGDKGWQWDEALEKGFIAVGWGQLGDLSGMTLDQFERRREATLRKHPDWGSGVNQVWRFSNIKKGDRIVANRGTREVLGIGTVTGPYYYDANGEMAHRLPVQWDDTRPRTVDQGGWRRTLIELNKEKFDAIAMGTAARPIEPPPGPALRTSQGVREKAGKPYSLDEAMDGLFMDRGEFADMVDLLRVKKNVILQGPPGVGKSFVAKRLAFALMEEEAEDQVAMVQFHPSYSYEDFIQGYRPREEGFSLKDGLFHQFCESARRSTRPHVFIIDEINRGNLGKIFGELMLLIEPDKRGPKWAMPLTYAKGTAEKFFVPDNLHLVGLMNTADRSLAMVDYALRRRFAFVELKAEFASKAFRSYLTDRGVSEELVAKITHRMRAVNEKIAADTANLGAGYCIGHSYFCGIAEDEVADLRWYRRIVVRELEPLLREYWFDDKAKADQFVRELAIEG